VYQARGRIIGLTATPGSDAEQREFKSDEERFTLYKIPPHQPSQRQDLPVQVEKNERAQQVAILRVLEAHGNQPVFLNVFLNFFNRHFYANNAGGTNKNIFCIKSEIFRGD